MLPPMQLELPPDPLYGLLIRRRCELFQLPDEAGVAQQFPRLDGAAHGVLRIRRHEVVEGKLRAGLRTM